MKYTEKYLKHLRQILDNIVKRQEFFGRKVLVTGATGLIGSALTDVLFALNYFEDAKIEILLAGRDFVRMKERFTFWEEKALSYDFVDYYAGKTTDIPVEKLDIIVHCAANSHPAVLTANPVETIMEAVTGLNDMLQVALKKQARLLYISSSEVYGKKDKNEAFYEKEYSYVDILSARSCYPSSKRVCETLCAGYKDEYGVDVRIVRPGHIYGPCITPNDSHVHAQFARNIREGKNIIMKSEGNQLRSYCYVLDCASAILSVLTAGEAGEAYNISNPDSVVTIRELAEMYASLSHKKVIFELPTENEKKGNNPMTCSALNSNKLLALGWKGMYDLKMGVQETIECVD